MLPTKGHCMDEARNEADANTSPPRRRLRVRGSGRHAAAARARQTRNAGRWVLAIAILQLAFGLILGFTHAKEADRALQELANGPADAIYEYEGQQYTAEERRAAIEKEKVQFFVLPIGLGVVFVALYVWSRKSPVPAIGSALGLFVTVHALEAVIDPATLMRGIIFKVFCVAGLAKGLKSALEERTFSAEAGEGPEELGSTP